VGRRGELALFDRVLDGFAAGRGAAVLLSGEPGIGKSRLLTELHERAVQRGVLVLTGRATEFERDEPFAVFTDALAAHLAALPPADRDRSTGADGALAAVLPGLRTAVEPTSRAGRLEIHYAVRGLLGRLVGDHGLVLVLDDLHWCDTASADLVGYLLRHPPAGPVLLAAAIRPGQCPQRLRRSLDDAAGQPGFHHLQLAPLDRDETMVLLGTDAATADELHAVCGGNPFYLLALAHQPGARTAKATGGSELPAAVRAALAAEVRRLSVPARLAAFSAAVVGDPFDADVARTVAELTAETFADALDELAAADLIRPTARPWRLRFRHPLVRHAVYDNAGPGWRQRAHARAAAALRERGAPALQRCRHVEHSAAVGDLEAVEVLTEAGETAAGHAPIQAAHWYSVALDLLPATAEHQQQRIDLLIPLAMCAGAGGDFTRSRQAADELLSRVPAELAPVRTELVAFRALLDHITGRPGDARRITERELAGAVDLPDVDRAALQIALATNALVRSDYTALAEHASAALAAARPAQAGPLLAVATALSAFAEYTLARFDRALPLLTRATALVDDLSDDDLAGQLDAALMTAHAEYNLGRCADAVRHATRGLDLARGTGQVMLEPVLYLTRACGHAFASRLGPAITDTTTAYEASLLTGNDFTAGLARALSGWVHLWSGDLATALRSTEQGMRTGERIGSAMLSSNAGLFHAEAQLEAGRHRAARHTLLDAGGGPELHLIERPWRGRAHQILIRACLADDDLPGARRWLAQAETDLTDLPIPARRADLLHCTALVHLAGGEHRTAHRAACAAITEAEHGLVPLEAARARILAGLALAGTGDRSRALAELQRSAHDLAALGAHRYRHHAVRELRRLGRRIPTRPATGEHPVLSRRELDVARLVAIGHTNRQIARSLVISEKTVETHVSRIIAKLDVPNRAAVGRALIDPQR
jgi:DNA-binding CsgD family transcriptional regulator